MNESESGNHKNPFEKEHQITPMIITIPIPIPNQQESG